MRFEATAERFEATAERFERWLLVPAQWSKARREVENLFFDNVAFSPERAVEFEARRPVQRRILDQMIAEGTVHEAAPGRYWLDLAVFKERRRKQFVWTMWIVALGAVVALIIAAVKHFT
jgi:hypothetical protein